MDDPHTAVHFPADVVDRAKELLADFPGGTGGYTDSRGSRLCRQMVASGIEGRDGYPADPDDIWLTDGRLQWMTRAVGCMQWNALINNLWVFVAQIHTNTHIVSLFYVLCSTSSHASLTCPMCHSGASPGVHMWLKMLIRNKNDCVLTPIPQYPLYSACLALYGGTLLPYYLDESKDWALSIPELRQSVETVRWFLDDAVVG